MFPEKPSSPDAGRKAESSPAQANQHVTNTDIQEKHIHRSAQRLELAEKDQHHKVVEEPKSHYKPQDHRNDNESCTGKCLCGWNIVPMVQKGVFVAHVKAVI